MAKPYFVKFDVPENLVSPIYEALRVASETGKVKKGSKAAKRRKSYCARSLGQLKRSSAKTRNNPNSRIRQARRRWKC